MWNAAQTNHRTEKNEEKKWRRRRHGELDNDKENGDTLKGEDKTAREGEWKQYKGRIRDEKETKDATLEDQEEEKGEGKSYETERTAKTDPRGGRN